MKNLCYTGFREVRAYLGNQLLPQAFPSFFFFLSSFSFSFLLSFFFFLSDSPLPSFMKAQGLRHYVVGFKWLGKILILASIAFNACLLENTWFTSNHYILPFNFSFPNRLSKIFNELPKGHPSSHLSTLNLWKYANILNNSGPAIAHEIFIGPFRDTTSVYSHH